MIKLKKNQITQLTFILTSIVLFIFGWLINNYNFILCSILLLIVNNIYYSFLAIKDRIVFLIFNITFFTLLLGKNFIYMLSGEIWYNKFDSSIEKNTLLLLYISLLCIFIGTMLFHIYKYFNKSNFSKKRKDINKKEILYIRKFLFFVFILTLIPSMIVSVEKIIFVSQNSYISLHSGFTSQIPFFVQKLSNTNSTFFWLYLATFPSQNKVLKVTFAYCVYLVITMLSGGRAPLIVGLITLIIYYVYRQYTLNEVYFNKKTLSAMAILGLSSIVFLSSYNILRNKQTIENFNPINQFKQFFIDQSNSVELISYAQEYKDELPETNSNYTFGIIKNVLLNKNYYIQNTNTVETALKGNNLGATLSYLIMGDSFLKGNGRGTQYIAELYTDYSYLGVVVYNLILGFALIALINVNPSNFIFFGISLNIISNLIYLPRQFAMGWMTYLFSTTVIFAVLLTYIFSRFIRRKLNENFMDS